MTRIRKHGARTRTPALPVRARHGAAVNNRRHYARLATIAQAAARHITSIPLMVLHYSAWPAGRAPDYCLPSPKHVCLRCAGAVRAPATSSPSRIKTWEGHSLTWHEAGDSMLTFLGTSIQRQEKAMPQH